jgi:hypothetical protein
VLTALSNGFTIDPAAPQLVFTTQPTDVAQGSTLNTIAVTKQDGYGNVYSADTDQVDFTVPPCGAFLIGSVNLSGGTATLSSAQRFYSLGSGLQVYAKDNSAALAVSSNAFDVADPFNDFVFSDGYDGCRP